MSRFKNFISKNGFYIDGHPKDLKLFNEKLLLQNCIYFENYIYESFDKLMLEITLYVDEATYKLAREIEEIDNISLEKLENFLYCLSASLLFIFYNFI